MLQSKPMRPRRAINILTFHQASSLRIDTLLPPCYPYRMKSIVTCLLLVAFIRLGWANEAGTVTVVPQPFPSPCTIVLQSNSGLSLGLKDFLAYLLPASGGGQEKFNIVQGLADPKCVSFESVQYPGYFLRHQNFQVKLHPYPPHDRLFTLDATFVPMANPQVQGGWMFRTYNNQELWISCVHDNAVFVAANPRPENSTFILVP